MKNSGSFNVDHSKLPRGIYLSKIDTLADVKTITLDLRLREPYKEEILSNVLLHTFEHCFATAIRHISDEYTDATVSYFGPMGCQTGFCLVINLLGYEEKEYFDFCSKLIKEALVYLRDMKEIPAKNELQCGYCYTLGEIGTAFTLADDMEELVDRMTQSKEFFKYTYL